MRKFFLLFGLLAGVLHTPSAVSDDVRYRFVPYLWTAGMDVEIGRPGQTRDVDVSFSDYVDMIDMGAAFVFEARGDRWLLATNFLWVQLGEEFNLPADTVGVDIDEFVIELFGGYRPEGWEELWIVGGARYIGLDVELELSGGLNASASPDFADPYVGLSWQPRRGNWEFLLEGDIGGGVDADFAWHVSAGVTHHFNERFGLSGVYRLIDTDYEDDNFVFDGQMDGILVGLMMTFE